MTSHHALLSIKLQNKIELLKKRRRAISLGDVYFDSPLLLAPLSSICTAPFRLLMEDLGAGGTVSELISCHGINYNNLKTKEMLKLDPREKNVGLQIFGEGTKAMSEAAKVVEEYGPKFIDINMGCPVKKVVGTGAGSSLLKDPSILPEFFSAIRKSITLPLSIKIRLGWDHQSINAKEIVHIAHEEGIEFVAIHGRTRSDQYSGKARWDLIEEIKRISPIPIIGNGDLHTEFLVKEKMKYSNCDALMLGRGPLRNPFIFLEAYKTPEDQISFTASDYFEVLNLLLHYMSDHIKNDHHLLISMRKHIIWMAAGFSKVAIFRDSIYKTPNLSETMKLAADFFNEASEENKSLNDHDSFMTSGHG